MARLGGNLTHSGSLNEALPYMGPRQILPFGYMANRDFDPLLPLWGAAPNSAIWLHGRPGFWLPTTPTGRGGGGVGWWVGWWVGWLVGGLVGWLAGGSKPKNRFP